jgi:hypothetical protein
MIAPLAGGLSEALTSRTAGPAASAVALVLAALLAVSWNGAAHREARLRAQVAALAARNEQAGVYWQAQLSSCRAEAARPEPRQGAITRTSSAAGDDVAERLANHGPAGFDVCARMEAADQAVLNSLRAK